MLDKQKKIVLNIVFLSFIANCKQNFVIIVKILSIQKFSKKTNNSSFEFLKINIFFLYLIKDLLEILIFI